MKKVRCAIYTRKSSEEGLEQDFNSLHAQREACSAYVLSQASEGWTLLSQEYDDGGLSGGTLQRPALQRLLADIEAGKVDIVVVYKVDRLTRSLLDFAKLVEALDKAGTSFVSVTQSFNTTTSMGRLTLNMLLSFAQFEREVTAERIRDKIAASKAKGMWMGGIVPLGYDADGRTLKIVEHHADLVQELFRRYLALGSVRLLSETLDAEGICVPERRTISGRPLGGGRLTRGQIYKILSNPIYVGEIHHQGKVYPGKHEAIIARDLWEQVQSRLAENQQGVERAERARTPSLLAGLIVDENGKPLVASHATKGKVRYRYYVSRSLQHQPGSTPSGMRIPALELEKTVTAALGKELALPLVLLEKLGLQPSPQQLLQLTGHARQLVEQFKKRERTQVRQLIEQAQIGQSSIELCINAGHLASALHLTLPASAPDHITISIDAALKRSGRAMRLLQENGRGSGSTEPQEHLVRLLVRARSWWKEMTERGLSAAALGREQGVTSSYASRVIRLNFLAPDIVEAIVSGTQPAGLDAKTLLNVSDLPLGWSEQKQQLHLH